MTPHREWIRDIKPYRCSIRVANDHVIWSEGVGHVVFNPIVDGKSAPSVVFNRVLYVPALKNNLFSCIQCVRETNIEMVTTSNGMTFSKDGQTVMSANIRGTVATLNGTTLSNDEHAFVTQVTRELLHQRLGHIGKDRLECMLRENLVEGVNVKPGSHVKDTCEHCIAGKQHRDPFPSLSKNRSKKVLQLIHTDLKGPIPTTLTGYKYWVIFVRAVHGLAKYPRVNPSRG